MDASRPESNVAGPPHLSAEQVETLRREVLRQLEEGVYGLCVECGGEIPFDRLLVFPETATCVDCSA